jgi:hypothetical protein
MSCAGKNLLRILILAQPLVFICNASNAVEFSCLESLTIETAKSMRAKGILPEIEGSAQSDYLRKSQENFVRKWNARVAGEHDPNDRNDRVVNSNFPIDRGLDEVLARVEEYRFDFSPDNLPSGATPFPFVKVNPNEDHYQGYYGEYRIDTMALFKSWANGNHILDLGAGNFRTALTLLDLMPLRSDAPNSTMSPLARDIREYYRKNGFPNITGFSLVDIVEHQKDAHYFLELGRSQIFTDSQLIFQNPHLNPVTGKFFEAVDPSDIANRFGLSSGGFDSEGVFKYTRNAPAVLAKLAAMLRPGAIMIVSTGSSPIVKVGEENFNFYKFCSANVRGFRFYISKTYGTFAGNALVIERTSDDFYIPPLILEGNPSGYAPHWKLLP